MTSQPSSNGSRRRRYSKAEKATAVIAAEVATASAASEQLGIPRKTLTYWLDDPRYAELRQKTREEAAAGFSVIMYRVQDRLIELIPEMEPRDLSILLGIAAEKAQLLGGGPTSRTETRSVTDGLDDHEHAILRDILDAAIAESAETVASGDPV